MPLYEYECDACGKRFEVIRKFSDPPLDVCTQCGKSPVRRLQSSPAIQFKGTGWYITDYSQKGKTGGESSSSKSEKGETEKGEKSEKGETKKTKGPADTAASKSEGATTTTPAKPSSSES